MITPDSAVTVGNVTGTGFLALPGLMTIGSGYDLSDIDLTAATLDERVRFACDSARLYWAADGTLKAAAADVWPLEYSASTGLAVGRTPPEPQATNYQLSSRGNKASSVTVNASASFITDQGTTVSTAVGPDGGAIGEAPTGFSLYGVYNATAGAWLVNATGDTPGSEWERIALPFTLSEAGVLRTYNARSSSSSYVYGLTPTAIPAGYGVSSFFRRQDGTTGVISGFVQVELGTYATSPIITDSTAVTRAAAFAYVLTQGAKGMTVSYSDGTSESFTFSGEYQYPLPNPSAHWGARYITKIAYQS